MREEETVYLHHPNQALLAKIYLPSRPEPVPLVATLHGGAWCRGDRLDDELMNQALAKRGIAVAALDFRMPPEAAYPASLADINYGIRWLKTHARRLGSLPELVSLMGLSSGGHQAMLAAMRPDDSRYAALDLPDSSGMKATVRSVVLCWPVIDPLGRYLYAQEWKNSGRPYPDAIDRVLPDHLKFWNTTEAMSEGSPLRILETNERVATPPVLCIQGDQDLIHPRDHIERFAKAYKEAGGSFTMRWFEHEAEGFIKKSPDSLASSKAFDSIAEFLKHQVI